MELVPGHLPRPAGPTLDVVSPAGSDPSKLHGGLPESEGSSRPDIVAWRTEPPAKRDSARAAALVILLLMISPGFE